VHHEFGQETKARFLVQSKVTQDDDGGDGGGHGAGARGGSSTPAVPASSPLVWSGKWLTGGNGGRSSEEDRDKGGQV
jgi:hypothetical protein